MDKNQQEELEALTDRYGLPELLDCLSDICFSKGNHIRSNWQDGSTAVPWEQMGGRLGGASDAAKKKGL